MLQSVDAGRGILTVISSSKYDIRPKWHEIGSGLKEFSNVDTLFTQIRYTGEVQNIRKKQHYDLLKICNSHNNNKIIGQLDLALKNIMC